MKDKYLYLIFSIKVFLARRSKVLDKYFAERVLKDFKKRVDRACKKIDLNSDDINIIW